MSAKRRAKSSSQVSLQHEMSVCGATPVKRGESTFSIRTSEAGNVEEKPLPSTGPQKFQSNSKADLSLPSKTNPPVGFFKAFCKGVRGLWQTRYTEDYTDREMIVKTTLRELAIYFVFVLILCIITFGMTSSTMFYFTKVMKDLFTGDPNNPPTFDSVGNMDDFFNYAIKTTLLGGLYFENFYNGDPVPDNMKGYIYFENKILGRPRLRQVRVKNASCIVADYFKEDIKECYAPFSSSVESTASFGLENGSAWTYASEQELNGRTLSGQMSSYSGGGFTVLLGATSDESTQILNNLKEHLWLDRSTRAVFIDFSVYNANINLFCIITLLFEFPATGGCLTFSTFRTLKLLRYVTTMDHFVMACEGLFIVFIVYYFIEESLEIKRHGKKYFSDMWNILDLVVIGMGFICMAFNIYRTVTVNKILRLLLEKQDEYANFESLSDWQTRFNDFVAVAVFLSWIKVFKYISFNKTMTQLQSTLSRCAKDIGGFAVMFSIVFCAYAQWGYLLLGTQVQDYSTFLNCIFTLFRIILGDFDFPSLIAASPKVGPVFFITYVFFVFFVLINMFLAIINDTYAEVKSDLAEQADEFQVGDYFKKGYDKMMSKLSFKREKIVDIQKALQNADANQDNMVDFEEWRAELKLRGHADAEIEAVFARYDVDGDRTLNELEQKIMHIDLEGQKSKVSEEIEEVSKAKSDIKKLQSKLSVRSTSEEENDGSDADSESGSSKKKVGYEEFTVLARRVDRVEHSIGNVVSKVDSVLLKLEAMDKAKIKRRETMSRLLDSISEQGLSESDKKKYKVEPNSTLSVDFNKERNSSVSIKMDP
ncbi:polycystin-2-like protein 1 isoform X5 [Hydra vulgaris]|uniref:Polycystin-2-like protein 1 isoform X5 n=2 Tax=Hydra vulgaris TaxID=6087 RepID=A0ABM4D6T6_HYDVU